MLTSRIPFPFSLAVMSVVVAFVPLARAQESAPKETRTGAYEVTFTERSPLSNVELQRLRYGLARLPQNVYETDKRAFNVYVPPAYDGGAGWGLLVWCGSGPVPEKWTEMLGRKKLIWISYVDLERNAGPGVWVGLALDAAWNMKKRYAIEETRYYTSGVSAGGKVAGIAAMGYPDQFDGAIPVCGMNYFREIQLPNNPLAAWPATFRMPPRDLFPEVRDHIGFAMITGENDPNQEPMRQVMEQGFKFDKFKYVSFTVVPGMGHQMPPVEDIERAIDELDAIPREGRNKRLRLPPAATQRIAAAATRRAAEAESGAVAAAEGRSFEAGRMLGLAQSYRSAGSVEKAKSMFERITKEYPETEEAKVAQGFLRTIARDEKKKPK